MAQNFDICIRGAGIVGKTLALLLARERLKGALVPAASPRNPAISDVRAYALNTASRRLLESLRSERADPTGAQDQPASRAEGPAAARGA